MRQARPSLPVRLQERPVRKPGEPSDRIDLIVSDGQQPTAGQLSDIFAQRLCCKGLITPKTGLRTTRLLLLLLQDQLLTRVTKPISSKMGAPRHSSRFAGLPWQSSFYERQKRTTRPWESEAAANKDRTMIGVSQ